MPPKRNGTHRLHELLEKGVKQRIFPGAVLRVEDLKGSGALLEICQGNVSSTPPGPVVSADTFYDVASLTKLFSATATLRLVANGSLSLDSPLPSLLPECGRHLSEVTVRHLLEHRSGLPAWRPFYSGSGNVLRGALAEPLETAPGSRHCYSDIGFMILVKVLERVSGLTLQHLMLQEVLGPLGLHQTGYRTTAGGEAAALELLATGSFAATEQCPYRGLLCGEVHDDNTWAMGGVAAHAGLFSTASQLAAFARGWWDAVEIDYLPADLREEAWAQPIETGTHVLGWDTVGSSYSSVGSKLSRRCHGHLGFTGTSLWIDPDRAVAIVLLSNRVHPVRNQADAIRTFRPLLHDAVADFVDQVQ